MRYLSRLLTASLLAFSLVLVSSGYASAQSGGSLSDSLGTPTTTQPASGQLSPGAAAQQGASLSAQYNSLTATMLAMWANSTGATPTDLVGSDATATLLRPGSSAAELRSMGVDGLLGDMDSTLREVTLGVGSAGIQFDKVAAALPSSLSTPDGAVIAAGVYAARSAAKLSVPDLTSPGLLANSAPLSSIGPESLAFGLFLNQSLTSLAQNSPDVFSSVMGAGGLTDPSSASAWAAAKSDASKRLTSGFSGDMLNPCMAVLMSSLASGSSKSNPALAASNNCNSCALAGSYMSTNMAAVVSSEPEAAEVENTIITPYEWFTMTDAQRTMLYKGYSEIAATEKAGQKAGSASSTAMVDCSDSSKGVSNFLASQSEGILERLGPR